MAETINKAATKKVVGTLLTLLIALVGVVYASIDKRIDSKADKSMVELMQKEVHELYLMHLNEGYKIPKEYVDDGCKEKN